MKRIIQPVYLLLTILFVSSPVFADYTYTYIGNPFTEVYGTEGYTTSDYIRGTIETPVQLQAGQSYLFTSLPAFSFTDGVQTINQANAMGHLFSLYVDYTGVIAAWIVSVSNPEGTIYSCAGDGCMDASLDFSYRYATGSGGNVPDNPGHWTAGTVPEPSSLLLLGVGAVAVLRKLRK
jgi:hypothetical protein